MGLWGAEASAQGNRELCINNLYSCLCDASRAGAKDPLLAAVEGRDALHLHPWCY